MKRSGGIALAGLAAIGLSLVVMVSVQRVPSMATNAQERSEAGLPVHQIGGVHSPDGTKNLTMVTLYDAGGGTTYSFIASDVDGKNSEKLYEVTLSGAERMSLSPNSWSPDNAYVFVIRRGSGGLTALVLPVDGSPLSEGQTLVDVGALFGQQITEYRIRDVTGWDANGLLHVFTYKDRRAKGPAFWFDISSRSFIELWNG